jgi:hypothetical protein
MFVFTEPSHNQGFNHYAVVFLNCHLVEVFETVQRIVQRFQVARFIQQFAEVFVVQLFVLVQPFFCDHHLKFFSGLAIK